jgi:outer membrane protein TolC
VPREKLRTINGLQLEPAPPTSQPLEMLVPVTQPTTAPLEKIELTIEEARQSALENNLRLRVQLLDPTISSENINQERARFEALFTANIDYSVLDTPTASQLNDSGAKQFSASPGVQIPLITGGQIDFNVPLNRSETDNQFSTLNPSYGSDARVSISQPLLRGFGTDANAQGIRVAFYSAQQSEARTKLEVIRVLADVERVYWRLQAAIRELEVRKEEFNLAREQLERARRQVRAGVAAEVEIVRAESGVADTLQNIIDAENRLRDRQRELKRVLNLPNVEMDSPTYLVPRSEPVAIPYKLDPQILAAQSLNQRMELLETELEISKAAASYLAAKNDTLPLVSLQYTYNVNGLGSSFEDSFTMVRDKDYEDHRVGLQLQIPIGNEAARSRLRQAIATRVQQLATRENQIDTIKQEVFNAVDQLSANYQKILAARIRVQLAARVLEAEIRQFEQGLRTSTEVLDAQTKLSNAQSAEVVAVAEYQIAQIDLAQATGTLLGASKVDWNPSPQPRDPGISTLHKAQP